MAAQGFLRIARAVRLPSSSRRLAHAPVPRLGARRVVVGPMMAVTQPAKHMSTTASRRLIVPDGQPKESVETPKVVQTPANITDAEYHQVADLYLDRLLSHLEKLQDKREDVDVEYVAGVLTVSFGLDAATYVINKQPPNKQIWLSSPKTGPKRYDYVILGDGQQDKQDTASGEWIYLRDNSTMNQLFVEEIGINLQIPAGHPET